MMPKKTDKEIIILSHIGGRLGNQLWLYTNVYAYCLEKDYKCSNPSFYAYNKYYEFRDPNPIVKVFNFLNNFKIDESHGSNYLIYTLYKYCALFMPIFQKGVVIKVGLNKKFNLSPTKAIRTDNKKVMGLIESKRYKYVYLDRGEFENPEGIRKYRKQIVQKFQPKKDIVEKVNKFLDKLNGYYLIAVHIRQGDYKRFMGGKLYFSQLEVANLLKHFALRSNKKIKFILFSDSKIDLRNFIGLNVEVGFGSNFIIEDMLTMSKCNLIIASESSFSSYAAYYGNKPLLNFQRDRHGDPYIKRGLTN